MKPERALRRGGLLLILTLLLVSIGPQPLALATDPDTPLGRWLTYDAAAPGFPAGYGVTAVAVDAQEQVWVGTAGGGIAAYDGLRWTGYTVASTGGGLAGNQVLSLAVDSGELWAGTTAGVSRLDLASGVWAAYTTANSGLPQNQVRAIAFSTIGSWPNLARAHYFATPAGLAQHSRSGGADSWHVYTTANSGLPSNDVRDIALDAQGRFWVVTARGSSRVDHGSWQTYTGANTPGCPAIELATRVLVDDAGGRVWFGTDGTGGIDPVSGQGACLFDPAANSWQQFHRGNSGLTSNTVGDLAIDAAGRVWLATRPFYAWETGGATVCTWVGGACYWKTYSAADGLASNRLLAAAAHADRLWFGTSDAGLSSFMPGWGFHDTDGVLALASQPGRLWVGTGVGLKRYDGGGWTTELAGHTIRAILPLAAADVWAGSDQGLHHWNGSLWQSFSASRGGLPSNAVRALARDGLGRLWVGTADAGVGVFDAAAASWARFDAAGSPLPDNHVGALAVDPQGAVWVGTNAGLARYDGDGWATYGVADGLPGAMVFALAVDPQGAVWAATSGGAARWAGGAWAAQTPAPPIGTPKAISVEPGGRIWLGGSAGAAAYDGAGWQVYTARNSGLTNDDVEAVAADADGGVWLGAIHAWVNGIPRRGGLYVRGVSGEPLGQPAPTISGFSPAAGPVDTAVTISGSNFDPRGAAYNQVEFRAAGFDHWAPATVLSATGSLLVARVPAAAVLGPIRVRAGATATSASDFRPIPTVSGFSPAAAVLGAPVEIFGSNFDQAAEVRFGGGPWYSLIERIDHGHLRVNLPGGSTSGPVQVRTEAGVGASGSAFSVGSGGPVVLQHQVHQGVPVGTMLVAGKSAVVRVFVATSDPALPAYVGRALLRAYRNGQVAFTMDGQVPNGGWFQNRAVQYTGDGSIDFVIPGSRLPAGTYMFEVELYGGYNYLKGYAFGTQHTLIPTSDVRLYVSAPGPAPAGAQLSLLQRQLAALARAYPVRDGVGALGSQSGIQYQIRGYPICDGTATPQCPGTGYLWDYWQQNPAGQRRAETVLNDMEGATSAGGALSWDVATVEAGKGGWRTFLARLRPDAFFPAGTTSLSTKVSIDSPSQAGGPDASVTVALAVARAAEEPAAESEPPAGPAPAAAPQLALSGQARRVFDADGDGATSPGDVIAVSIHFENRGGADAQSARLSIDYDEAHMVVFGSGGLMLGGGGAFQTKLVPGQFYTAAGWLPNKHDPPLDENYNGLIDTGDLASFVVEFDDWDPASGAISVSTDLTKLDPGEVVRNFQDSNRNGKHDSGEARSAYVRRGDNAATLLWNIPWAFMGDYNKTAAPGARAEFSALWFWKGVNAFMGPGQGESPGFKTWADVGDHTGVLHELGHNMGQVQLYSPHRTPAGHSTNSKLVGVAAGYDLVGRRVLTTTQMLSIMYPFVQSPVEDSFFEPFEYFDVFSFLRFHQAPALADDAGAARAMFAVSGLLSQDGTARIDSSYLARGLAATPSDPAGAYALVFLDGRRELARHSFGVPFWGEDRTDLDRLVPLSVAPFAVVAPLPDGTTAVDLVRGGTRLARLERSAAPPRVQLLQPNGGERFPDGTEALTISWRGADDDGGELTYAVRYSADNGATWQTLAVGLRGTQLSVPLAGLPGGEQALVEVEAGDGFQTASDRSDGPFFVGAKAPQWATIVSPGDGEQLVYGQPLSLVGAGYDLEDGALTGRALSWASNRDGALGSGEWISPTLTTGRHIITLTARDRSGRVARGTVGVEVLADFDRDGLADSYEAGQRGLSWWSGGDAGADPDADGLTSRGEAAWGTDPADADSDGDQVADGAEVAQGSAPTDPGQQPRPAELLASQAWLHVSVAVNSGPVEREILLLSSTPERLDWTARTEEPWLSALAAAGSTPGRLLVRVSPGGRGPGIYQGRITLQGGAHSLTVPVTLEIVPAAGWRHRLYLPLVLS